MLCCAALCGLLCLATLGHQTLLRQCCCCKYSCRGRFHSFIPLYLLKSHSLLQYSLNLRGLERSLLKRDLIVAAPMLLRSTRTGAAAALLEPHHLAIHLTGAST